MTIAVNQDKSTALPLPLSRLVLGTMTFGTQTDPATAEEMIRVAGDAGMTMIDTGNVYAYGGAEEIIGRALRNRRDDFMIATKVGIASPDVPDGATPLSRTAIRACLDASLRRLGTDRVEVYYLHQPDRSTPIAETLQTLAELVDEGKIRQVGVSNYAAWQIAEMRHAAELAGQPVPTISQPIYNVLSRRIEEEYVEYTIGSGVTNVVYNPLAGGLLTGKHRFEQPDADGRFAAGSEVGDRYRDRYWSRELFASVDQLATAAADHGLTLVQLALRWLLGREGVDAVILGSSRVEHLRDNIAATDGPALPADLLEICDRVWNHLRGPAPTYNR